MSLVCQFQIPASNSTLTSREAIFSRLANASHHHCQPRITESEPRFSGRVLAFRQTENFGLLIWHRENETKCKNTKRVGYASFGAKLVKVSCMANQRRVKMVSQQIRREISEMLLFDKVLKEAITPEFALGADKFLSSVATISDVEVSADLQVVKVYVSVFGDERGQEKAIEGLKSKASYVRSGLGKRMKLRFTPEVRFIRDDSLERGSKVWSILSQLEEEREALKQGKPVYLQRQDDSPPRSSNLSPTTKMSESDLLRDWEREEEELGKGIKAQKRPKKKQSLGPGKKGDGVTGMSMKDVVDLGKAFDFDGNDDNVFFIP